MSNRNSRGGNSGIIRNPQARAQSDTAYATALAREEEAAMNRARGGPGTPGNPIPMSQPHDFRSFDAMFHPKGGEAAVAAAHPNIQSVANPPPIGTTMLLPGQTAPVVAPKKQLDVNNPAVQTALDKVPGTQVAATPAPGRSFANNFGTGSVSYAKPGAPVTPSAPIFENGKTVGVGRAQDPDNFNLDQSHANLYAAYPKVFQAGTDENKAFVDHANTKGLRSAYENASSFLDPITQRAAGVDPGAQTAGESQQRSQLPAAGSNEQQVSNAATQKGVVQVQANAASPFAEGSILRKIADAATTGPSLVDTEKGYAKSALGAVGLSPTGISQVGNAVSNYATALVNPVAAIKAVGSLLPQTTPPDLSGYTAPNVDSMPTVPAATVSSSPASAPTAPASATPAASLQTSNLLPTPVATANTASPDDETKKPGMFAGYP